MAEDDNLDGKRGITVSSKTTSILIVDDDIRMLRMMKRMLELENFQTLTANNGESALKVFEKDTPDLVLLDIMMPDMNGYTVCQHIRELSNVPIIMVIGIIKEYLTFTII